MNISELIFKPEGRINRSTFWLWWSIIFVLPFILMNRYESELESIFEYYWLAYFVILYPSIMIQIKRWHDRNKSGWWFLINFIPFGNLWALIECGFLAGDKKSNKYGPPTLNKQLNMDSRGATHPPAH